MERKRLLRSRCKSEDMCQLSFHDGVGRLWHRGQKVDYAFSIFPAEKDVPLASNENLNEYLQL